MSSNRLPQEVKNKTTEMKANLATAANAGKEKVQEVVSSVAQKAQESASAVSQKVQDLATTAVEKTQAEASALLQKSNEGIAAVGQQMSSLAGTVREAAQHEGVAGSVATHVADTLSMGGHYLEEHRLQDIGEDASRLVRQYPLQSLLVGFGVGCLLGMALSRR